MIHAVVRRYWTKLKWVNALKAADVVSVLLRVGSALMVCIDTAYRAEIVLRRLGIELVQTENVGTFYDANAS